MTTEFCTAGHPSRDPGRVALLHDPVWAGFPFIRTDKCHGCRYGHAERSEAVEHGDADPEHCDLTVELARGEAPARQLVAVHPGFGAAATVTAVPSSADRPAEVSGYAQDLVAGDHPGGVGLPGLGVLAGREGVLARQCFEDMPERCRPAGGDRLMALARPKVPCVVTLPIS